MQTKEEMVEHWNKMANDLLLNRKITEVAYASDEEVKLLGIHSRPLIFSLDDGTNILVMSDEEGNDAGSLMLQSKGRSTVLPSLW